MQTEELEREAPQAISADALRTLIREECSKAIAGFLAAALQGYADVQIGDPPPPLPTIRERMIEIAHADFERLGEIANEELMSGEARQAVLDSIEVRTLNLKNASG